MGNGFLVCIENRNGKIRKASLEALSTARRLADALGAPVAAAVFGGPAVVEPLKAFGPDSIHAVEIQAPGTAREAFIDGLERLVKSTGAAFVLAGATASGRDLLPGVAARFGRSVVQDVTEIAPEGGTLRIKRPIYAGKASETVRVTACPAFVTLRPNVFELSEKPGSPNVVATTDTVDAARLLTLVKEIKESSGGKVELTEASVIVSGGRGIKDAENYRLIEELADVLGAAAGASRAVVDAGWVDHPHQVGQTGKTVSPQLYIAVGISGAIQHLAGMSSSKVIVAINKDPEAPIFKVANYGIVGDLFKVVPLLTQELKRVLQ
ncbi:MAG: electron transfer flavoprotein subunit alpha/FixB family protein [Acidobacteria bacterium]|nr:electron transfer flavoprotein subunit alpha/FixB family protein [Acidobacteriota bacterium]